MATSKPVGKEQAADLARFMNDKTEGLWNISIPGSGYRLIGESSGHKLASLKLVDEKGNPKYFLIEGVQPTASARAT